MQPNYVIEQSKCYEYYMSNKNIVDFCLILNNYIDINKVGFYAVSNKEYHNILSACTVAIFKVKKKTKTIDSLHS